MSSSNRPQRILGLQGKEWLVIIGLGLVLCVGIGAGVLIVRQLAPAVSTALRGALTWTPEATRRPTVPVTPTLVPTPTVTSTPTPTATPAPTATPRPGISRRNPLPPGSIVEMNGWEIQVLDLMRGAQAATAIRDVNQFNPPAPEGREYVAIKVHVKSTHTDGQSHRLGSGDFRLTGDRLVEYLAPGVVPPKPALKAELFSGGEAEGWLVYTIGQSEGHLQLDFDPLGGSDTQPVFIALMPDAAIPVDPQLTAAPLTTDGQTREQPASLNEALITEDWAVTLLKVVRGEDAWQMTLAANQFNDPAPAGQEYLAAFVRVRNLNPADKTIRIDSSSFKTIGSANALYDAPSVVDPDPPLEAALYPGGEVEGWVILQIGRDETNVEVVFDPIFDFQQVNRRFMAIGE